MGVPESYGFLWIFEILWYTLEGEARGCTRIIYDLFGFLKIFGTLGRMTLVGVPEVLWFSLDFEKIWYTFEE